VNNEIAVEGGDPPIADNYSTWGELADATSKTIAEFKPADTTMFDRNLEQVAEMVARLRSRGTRVVFAILPTSGFISDIEARRYPRNLFAQKVAERLDVQMIATDDFPATQGFVCPDGSHLDGKDRRAFTEAFAKLLWP
jgi:hypothetical protein